MKIVIATSMDFDAIYIDGIKYAEDSALYACDLVTALEDKMPCTVDSMEVKSVDEEWWYDIDRECYPDKIEKVKFEE